ncbi:hypothetical protein AB0G02_13805 [Actinosynnema sp. NPDC023658]|uniref:hypothetical protein n=1 Tax=Actinosynnema sp. NPDC023658 TaxID=3155465 RepID=UPI0033C66AD2
MSTTGQPTTEQSSTDDRPGTTRQHRTTSQQASPYDQTWALTPTAGVAPSPR